MKLNTKIIVLVVATSVALMAVEGTAAYLYTKSARETSICQMQFESAQGTLATIDRTLYERYQNVQMIARDHLVSSFVSTKANRTGLYAPVAKEIANYTVLTGPWDDIVISDTKGTILFSPDASPGTIITQPDELEAITAAASGQVYYSDVHMVNQKPTVTFSAPVYDESGKSVIGVVRANYAWSVIENIVGSTAAASSNVYLFNKQGLMIATNGDYANLLNPKTKDVLSPGEPATLVKQDIEGTTQVLASHALQQGYLSYKGSGWHLTIETPVGAVLAVSDAVAVNIVGILSAALLVSVLSFVFFLIRTVINPITKLQSVVRDITGGNLALRAEVTSEDEIGVLASSFNAMTNNLVRLGDEANAVIRTLPEPLFIMNKRGEVTSLNPAAEEMLGQKEDDLLGKSIEEVLKGESKKTVRYVPDPDA